MDYRTFRPMTKPSKPRKTFTRNNFAQHNYNYAHSSRANYPPRKNNIHVCSHCWDNPMTTTNSVNFQTTSHPPQDHSENYPFFQQNKNKKQTSQHTDYLLSDDDYLQPDIFAQYTQEYCTQRPRQPQSYKRIFPENPTDIQNQQPICQTQLIHNFFNHYNHKTKMTMHSYQPNQMQNEIPLPYFLQQHEI